MVQHAMYAIVDTGCPRPTNRDIFRRKDVANQELVDRLTVNLQYGSSNLEVVPVVVDGSAFSPRHITPCLTEADMRVWRKVRGYYY